MLHYIEMKMVTLPARVPCYICFSQDNSVQHEMRRLPIK